jgi:hypothetical protein
MDSTFQVTKTLLVTGYIDNNVVNEEGRVISKSFNVKHLVRLWRLIVTEMFFGLSGYVSQPLQSILQSLFLDPNSGST